VKLTKKKSKWAKQFKPAAIKGGVLRNNVALEERYRIAIENMTRKMIQEAEKEIKRLYKKPAAKEYFTEDASVASQARILLNALSKKFDDIFGPAVGIIERMVNAADKSSKSATAQSMKDITGGLTVKTDVMSADMRETMKALITQNVSLITSIKDQYLKDITGAVMRSITSGQGLNELLPQIQNIKGITERRAKNIALDQTRKAYNSINSDRMRKVGVKKFEWIHSGGSLNPRQDHIDMNGNIYSFDDLPVIDKRTGERGLPGQAPNCKCTMRPVVEFGED